MAVITQYVVQHRGVEKLVTTDKKEADKYDKMLEVADNLSSYISSKGIALDDQISEELSILLSKNKDAIAKLFKGVDVAEVLEQEKAEVVAIKKA